MRGQYLFFNTELISANQWDETSVQGIQVYEVLRMIKGAPLFFEDHIKRLQHSFKLIGETILIDKNILFNQFIELGKKNLISEGNIKLNFIINAEGYTQVSYFIPHSYPSESDYRKGVKVGFLDIERKNPEAKVEQGVNEKIKTSGQDPDVYEVMLVNKEGLITEGSRSNMVFIKVNTLYTCPLKKVLRGVTLAKVLEIASRENIQVFFEAVPKTAISTFDALFITGTSPKLLPVALAGDIHFDVHNPLMHHLMARYNKLIKQEIINAKQLQKTS